MDGPYPAIIFKNIHYAEWNVWKQSFIIVQTLLHDITWECITTHCDNLWESTVTSLQADIILYRNSW